MSYNGTVSIDLSEFRELADKIGAALFRCRCAVEEYNRRMGDDPADGDYHV